jgi:hypothetical protein
MGPQKRTCPWNIGVVCITNAKVKSKKTMVTITTDHQPKAIMRIYIYIYTCVYIYICICIMYVYIYICIWNYIFQQTYFSLLYFAVLARPQRAASALAPQPMVGVLVPCCQRSRPTVMWLIVTMDLMDINVITTIRYSRWLMWLQPLVVFNGWISIRTVSDFHI